MTRFHKMLLGLAMLVIAHHGGTDAAEADDGKLKVGDTAPSLQFDESVWFNTMEPITLAKLGGKKTLLVFDTVW